MKHQHISITQKKYIFQHFCVLWHRRSRLLVLFSWWHTLLACQAQQRTKQAFFFFLNWDCSLRGILKCALQDCISHREECLGLLTTNDTCVCQVLSKINFCCDLYGFRLTLKGNNQTAWVVIEKGSKNTSNGSDNILSAGISNAVYQEVCKKPFC